MNGAETQYDPSRHGPMAERGGAQISPSRMDPRLTKSERPPTVLEELQHRLGDSIETTQTQANRVREFVDSILGNEPEPGRAGNGIPEPPSIGRGNALLDQGRALAQSLIYLREQVDRLSRI